MNDLPEYDTVGWAIMGGCPWWPMYVCDPQKLRPKLHRLGEKHSNILKKAKGFPDSYRIVYWFGSGTFSLMRKGQMRAWNSDEHEKFVDGFPKAPFVSVKKAPPAATMEDLKVAIEEAEDFLAQDESMRLLPHMVPSDMNPSMDPPPSDDDMDDEEEGDDEHGDDEVEKDEQGGDEADDDDDDDEKPIKPKKKDKKDAKKSKKKSSSKRKSKDEPDETKSKKRKKSTKKDVEVAPEDDAKPVKKKASTSDAAEDAATPVKTEAKAPDDESLKTRIEEEIRKVLSTGDLEQLTTRKLREHLTVTLKMDLKNHKDTIKEVVNRIISAMDPVEAPQPEAVPEPEAPPAAVPEPVEASVLLDRIHGATGHDVKAPLELLLPIAAKLNDTQIAAISARVAEWTAHEDARLAEMAKSLAATWKLEPPAPELSADKIVALKATLEADGTPNDVMLELLAQLAQARITLDVLKKTKIIVTVAQLRHHVYVDGLVATLSLLGNFVVIEEIVCSNDKVSTAAKDLRNKWKKDFMEAPPPSTTTALGLLSKLETMRRELEKDSASDDALQAAQVATLHELASMNLTANDIVASQIGHVLSKFRKAKNETLAKAAKSLKQKWLEMATDAEAK